MPVCGDVRLLYPLSGRHNGGWQLSQRPQANIRRYAVNRNTVVQQAKSRTPAAYVIFCRWPAFESRDVRQQLDDRDPPDLEVARKAALVTDRRVEDSEEGLALGAVFPMRFGAALVPVAFVVGFCRRP